MPGFMSSAGKNIHKLSAAGVLVTLGIIFGDIGTSPIYVLSAVVGDHTISRELVLGGLSCVFWTLFIITTFKYVYLALNNDNRGEGGIFALYAIHRRFKVKWAIIPALIGCAALIADGFITPPISIYRTTGIQRTKNTSQSPTEDGKNQKEQSVLT